MYKDYVVEGVYNSVQVDDAEEMLEPVWSIQKDQRDKTTTQSEREAFVRYRNYVTSAMQYLRQEDETEREMYDHFMRLAIDELKLMYLSAPCDMYTFTCGGKTFKHRVPGTPIYVTESNYCSRYLCVNDRTYFVFWTNFGRYNIAYVNSEIRDEFGYACGLLAYDFTCQKRTTLADDIFAFVPHAPPSTIQRLPNPLMLWRNAQDGISNSGARQLVNDNEVTIDRTSLRLMAHGLKQNIYTYAHKIGTMMWLHKHPEAQMLFVWCGLYQSKDRQTWAKTAKAISLALKPILRLQPDKISKLVEADSLANRHEEDELDWAEEKKIRTTPVDNLIPVSYIEREAERLFNIKKAQGVWPRRQSMDDYIMELPMSIPEGAWYEPLVQRDPKLRAFLDRHGMSDNVAGSKAIHILNCKPETIKMMLRKRRVDVSTQIKVEWSKLRALYPTDVSSNLQCAFVTGEVEKYLPANCLIGAGYSDSRVAEIVGSYERAGYGISAGQDYKGFNEQHKRQAMQAIMRAWLRVYRSKLHREQIETMELVIRNFERNYIRFPDGEVLRLCDTLMSGSRWTTFLNTMFNYIYSKFIHQAAGVRAVTFHVGDDVYGRYSSLSDAEKVIYVANRLNVHMQVEKCFVYGSSEFLRRQYVGNAHYQYLCRSIATLVHSRWERDEPVRLKDRLSGLYNRMLNFLERGGLLTAVNWAGMLSRVAAGKLPLEKIQYMLSLPSDRGGVRSCPEHDHAWVRLLQHLGLYRENRDALIIEDHEATAKLYRAIERLPLVGYAAERILYKSDLPSRLIPKMKAFLSHRFTACTKFDNTRLVFAPDARTLEALARYVDHGPTLDFTYSRLHPYVRAMYAARRRGAMRRWFLSML